MSKLLRAVSFASASLKTLAIAIVLVLCGASDAFAQSFLVCPPDGDVNCIGDVPSVSFLNAAESGYDAVSIIVSDATISGSACDYTIARTWTVTFSGPEGSFTESCSSIFRIADFEDPTFVNAPANATYQCIEEVPAFTNLTAIDDCSGDVVVQQFGESTSADDTLVCDQVTTPAGPGQDWSIWLDGLYAEGLATTDWYKWYGTPSLVFSNNGRAHLVG